MRLPKYIIIRKKNGAYRFVFGYVELHFELLDDWTDECDKVMGGGFWRIDYEKKQIVLHGKSSDYGRPSQESINKAVETFKEDAIYDLEVFWALGAPRELQKQHLDPADEFWRLDMFTIVNEDKSIPKTVLKT